MTDSVLRNKCLDFAVRIVNLNSFLRETKGEYTLSKQVLRSGTSIGANSFEAAGAQSDADFITRLHIALKEANETSYWLLLLNKTDYISLQQFESLNNDLEEVKAILISSLKTTKTRMNK